jgi:WD40 repeat protein
MPQFRERYRLAVILVLVACGGDGGDSPVVPDPLATRVGVTDSLPSLFAGDTLRLYASATAGAGASSHAVTWSSLNAAVATVDASGIVTGVAPGTATVRATVDTAKVDVPVVVLSPSTHAATQLSYLITAPGNFTVRVANVDGSIARTLTGPGGVADVGRHGWSPDGALLFSQLEKVTARTTTVTDASGAVVHDLPSFPEIFPNEPAPDISPDNARVIYTSGTTTSRQVTFMTLATKSVTLHSFIGSVFGPAWSPDGRRWAAVERIGGVFSLLVARADGTGERLIPMNAATLGFPRWSPDGRYIAMALDHQIAIVTPDARVSTTVGGCGTGVGTDCSVDWVSWSPNGKSLVYSKETQGVIVRPVFGSSEVVVGSGLFPDWSPDGVWIAFVTLGSGTTSPIQLVHPDGTGLKPLNSDVNVGRPIWRP